MTFSHASSKRDSIPSSGGIFNLTQSLPATPSGALALSLYAKAASSTDSDPVNCIVMLCNSDTCGQPQLLTTDWALMQFSSISESVNANDSAVFSVWCAAPAYVGLDNIAINRAVAVTQTVTASVPQRSSSDRYYNHTITLKPQASTVTTSLVSDEFVTNSIYITTVLPASTITETSYAPQLTTTVSEQAFTLTSLSFSVSNLTITQTLTPSPSTLIITLPAITEFLPGPIQTETALQMYTSVVEPSILTLTTTLPAQTQTTYIYGPTYTATALSVSSIFMIEVETFTPLPVIETNTLTYSLSAQILTRTTSLVKTESLFPATITQ